MERRYELDWLRVLAFALLMLFHTGMLFSRWDWHVKNLETSETLTATMGFLHDWRMPLLFFISGSAVWFAMDRYSTWKYFLERHKRLLLPLVFGMLVVIPPQIYYERLHHHQHFDSFADFYRLCFNHPWLKYANEAVYPFYILHQTVIVILGYYLVYLNWSIPAKFLVVLTGMFFITWGLYAFCIKPLNLLRVVFGMKWACPRHERSSEGQSTTQRQAEITSLHASMPSDVPPARASISIPAILALSTSALILASCSPSDGKLLTCTLEAPSLAQNRMRIPDRQPLAIYLPPSYERGSQRYPVLYLIPNLKTELWRYTGGSYQGFRLKAAMDQLIQGGLAQEMVVVIPNSTHWLGGSWYKNSPLTGNWEDYIVRDVVSYVDSEFRTIASAEGRAVAGHGMGGTGALEIALKHPDVFGSVYAMSPALFDENGLNDLGILDENQLKRWQVNYERWSLQDERARFRSFRDHVQTRLSSPSRAWFFEGLYLSYAAAVSVDLSLPFPHIAFPMPGQSTSGNKELLQRFENGLGGWEAKIARYLATGTPLKKITIEFGRNDEYDWIRRGANHVSELLRLKGVPNELVISEGGHDSTLGSRLEKGMLPAVSRTFGPTGVQRKENAR